MVKLSPSARAWTTTSTTQSSRVVVGIDEDPGSLQALRFAADEAALRGGEVLAMHVWHSSSAWGNPDFRPDGGPADGYVRDRLAETVGTVSRERELQDKPLVRIHMEALEGIAEVELTMAAVGAAMLVLGQRHHHRLFGSVSQASLRRAPCVIVIVPPPASTP
ncbi:nucleotide-binding universal stress UspA family protein [Nakamurella sp. UYEF19]|uniref:universal stress protein n=1 Tax=Nakamurella sp. UYEF19 TaxID=1756392 RepID=UPI003391CB8C